MTTGYAILSFKRSIDSVCTAINTIINFPFFYFCCCFVSRLPVADIKEMVVSKRNSIFGKT